MTWQDEVSAREWDEWQSVARKAAKSQRIFTTLGAEDYAAAAIEKLLMQPQCPANVEAWLRTTIKNQYIDRFRKVQARGGATIREWSDDRWEEEMVSRAVGSPSILVVARAHVSDILSVLKLKEKEMLIMHAAGFDNHQIAHYMNYASNKIVATRLAQIKEKVKTEVEKISPSSNPT
jgi:DNA-directed RNA polymerase specialized sigma24 family protein